MSLKAEIRREIDALRKLEEQVFGPRHGKTDFYKFLEAVWSLYRKWRAPKKSKRNTKVLAGLYQLKLRKNTHPIRAIIDASSQQHATVKSRWTRALEFVEKNRSQVKNVGFDEFVESNGGIGGCAGQIAKPRATKKPKGKAGVGWAKRNS